VRAARLAALALPAVMAAAPPAASLSRSWYGVPADATEATSFGAARPLVSVAGAEPQNGRAQLIPR
jgi:hypothetical protein